MKKLFALPLLFLLFCCKAVQQPSVALNPVHFNKFNDNQSLYQKLGINDPDALIVSVLIYSSWSWGKSTSYLAVLSDGRMFKYHHHVHSLQYEDELRSAEITDVAEKEKFIKLINATADINPDKLDIQVNEKGKKMLIYDAAQYEIKLRRGDNVLELNSYAPYDFIKYGAIGKEDRQKLIDFADEMYFYNDLFREVIYIEFDADEEGSSITEDKHKTEFKLLPAIRDDKFVYNPDKHKVKEVLFDDVKDKLLTKKKAMKSFENYTQDKVDGFLKNTGNNPRMIAPSAYYYPSGYFSKIYLYKKTDEKKGLLYEVDWYCKAPKMPYEK